MQLNIAKHISSVKQFFSPLGKFERAMKVLSKSPGFYDDDDGYNYCKNEKRQRRKDGCAVRQAMECADKAFQENAETVLRGLSSMNGWGDSHIKKGEMIESKRNRLLGLVNRDLAHNIRIEIVNNVTHNRYYWGLGLTKGDASIIDDLKRSSEEMLSSKQVVMAFKGLVCLSNGHYRQKEQIAAAEKAVDLIEPCHALGVSKEYLGDAAYRILQYSLSDTEKLMAVWKKLELGKQIKVFKHSTLDYA